MALLSVKHRKAIFQYLGLGEYNAENIKAFQKKYMLRKKDYDGIYGQDTDSTLRTVYYVKKYTKNFEPKEFQCECGGKYCCGYPSYMKPAQLILLQAIRDKYGKPIIVTSGLRCKTWNSKCGGSIQNSLHMSGQATDFYQQGVTDTLKNRKATIKWLKKQKSLHYSYGDGINSNGVSVSAPYMGNALHVDTYNDVTATYPTYKETPKIIDISEFQNTIDFAKVKADGIKGVIVRCGYRGAEKGTLNEDARFIEHIKGAYKAGLPVGIYMFTQAINEAEGKAEAEYAVKMWRKANVPLSFPIAIDTESVSKGRANDLTKAERTTVIKAFCDEIIAQGYEPMIYASTSWLNNKLNMSKLPYKVWVAQYASKCEYKGSYIIWQYASNGSVKGISGKVDMDYLYFTPKETPCPKQPKKSVDEVAKEVIDGKWGNGDERKKELEDAGYDYDAVQKRVNELIPSARERLAAKAGEYAYSTNTSKAHYPDGAPKAAYKTALYKAYPGLKNLSSAAAKGASCDVYVGVSVRSAGIDDDFPRGLSPSYLAKSKKFERIDKEDVKKGDIIVTSKHICIAWSDGEVKEASNGDFWPKTTETLTTRLNASGAKVYRAK